MMRGLVLLFTLHFGDDHPEWRPLVERRQGEAFRDRGVRPVASRSAGLRVGWGRANGWLVVGATVVTSAVSVGKEIHDRRTGGTLSVKDLTWDAGGLLAGESACSIARSADRRLRRSTVILKVWRAARTERVRGHVSPRFPS